MADDATRDMQAGKGVAVLQALEDYRRTEANSEFMRAIIQGLADIEAGHEVSLAQVRVRCLAAAMKWRNQ